MVRRLTVPDSPDIDKTVALKLSEEYPIAIISSNKDDIKDTIKTINDKGGSAELFITDSSSNDYLAETISSVTQRFGKTCAVAIYQLQYTPNAAPFLKQTLADLKQGSVVPIEGAYGFAQHTLPLLASGTTHPPTLLFSSPSGDSYYDVVNENALIALSRSLAREFGSKGVHVGHVRVRRTGDADVGSTAASHVRISPGQRLNCALDKY